MHYCILICGLPSAEGYEFKCLAIKGCPPRGGLRLVKEGRAARHCVVESRGNEKQAMARGWRPQMTRKVTVPERRADQNRCPKGARFRSPVLS